MLWNITVCSTTEYWWKLSSNAQDAWKIPQWWHTKNYTITIIYTFPTRAIRECKLRQGHCSVALCSVSTYRIKYPSPSVKESEKLIVDLHPDLDRHQNVTTARWSPLTYVYQVWSTSITTSIRRLSYTQTDTQTDRQLQSHNSTFGQ